MAGGAYGALPVAIKHLLGRTHRRAAPTPPILLSPVKLFVDILAGEARSEMKGEDYRWNPWLNVLGGRRRYIVPPAIVFYR